MKNAHVTLKLRMKEANEVYHRYIAVAKNVFETESLSLPKAKVMSTTDATTQTEGQKSVDVAIQADKMVTMLQQ